MARRKQYPLRVDPVIWEAIERWAADEMRSANGRWNSCSEMLCVAPGVCHKMMAPQQKAPPMGGQIARIKDCQICARRCLAQNCLLVLGVVVGVAKIWENALYNPPNSGHKHNNNNDNFYNVRDPFSLSRNRVPSGTHGIPQ